MGVKFAGATSTDEFRLFPENIIVKPELNGRHDKPDIEWLIKDILEHGQIMPIPIRKDGEDPVLVAGFSRWRAISEINKRNLAPTKMRIRCCYVRCDEVEGFLLNIAENRFRNPTTAIDDAHNIKRLLNIYSLTEEQIAGLYFPTAKTQAEFKEAKKFVKERISLISLSAESVAAVKDGRITDTAAVAISKLSQAQQHEVLKKKGTIEKKDVTPKKAPKPKAFDPELLRRVTAMLEDIDGVLRGSKEVYIEVDRKLLLAISDYVNKK